MVERLYRVEKILKILYNILAMYLLILYKGGSCMNFRKMNMEGKIFISGEQAEKILGNESLRRTQELIEEQGAFITQLTSELRAELKCEDPIVNEYLQYVTEEDFVKENAAEIIMTGAIMAALQDYVKEEGKIEIAEKAKANLNPNFVKQCLEGYADSVRSIIPKLDVGSSLEMLLSVISGM